ncbi:unnamed protein product [Effrenium voratum]|uniref:Erythroid differentiation-related factor 1 n=1 Tax=Effrenium voratum TaxID=2562239 RepID=A0AA36I2Y1_9DINO|nr:unnamed protein product [Effrenium voratum]
MLHSNGEHDLPRRSRSWSPSLPPKSQDLWDDEGDSEVLFDACRFPRPTGDLLDCVIGEEPWQTAETCDGRKVRVVGEASALKRLFQLPLHTAGEALCLHRIGDCLVVLEASNHALSEVEDLDLGQCQSSPRSPRVNPPRCQVRVDGDMVRVFPVVETAEPVQVDESPISTPSAACCEWRVREGLSLLALVPRRMSSGESGLADLSRSSQLRLLDAPCWPSYVSTVLRLENVGGSLIMPHDMAKARPALPEYHRRVTEDLSAVLVVPLNSPLETRTLVDSWLSCCLYGSPSLLCFFVDADGICRGCRFVLAADIPYLEDIAKGYTTGASCLTSGATSTAAFEPRALREVSHSLLETLVSRCDRDGGHFLLVPSPLGPRLLRAGSDSDDLSSEEAEGSARSLGQEMVDLPAAKTAFQPREEVPKTTDVTSAAPQRLRAAAVTQALLMYHAAVRLAQGMGAASTELKQVPAGSRWTAKSCRHPLRVRQMMLRSVRALRRACAEEKTFAPLPRRFQLLLASAHEFLADTFLAEEVPGDLKLDISRYMSALRHLQKSKDNLAEYTDGSTSDGESKFARSVKHLAERLNAKAVNAHLCLARLQQRHPWCDTSWCNIGLAMKALDAAEELVLKPTRATPPRQMGAYECSLLASISKWKADHVHELATLALTGAPELAEGVREYLEECNESLQALPTQCERWLQSTVSLSLRALHQLAAVPSEVASELQVQARLLLARAYSKLGHLYASTGRFTKAMTHAKQGIELFNATKDRLEAAKLQIWLCRLQLRMALQAAAGRAECLEEDPDLLCGVSAASPAEQTTLQQVVQQLQKALNALDSSVVEEQHMYEDGQALLGRVVLRQALVKLAKAPAPFNSCSRLCEDASVFSALELLQTQDDDAASSATTKEAIEKLHQAVACFRSAESQSLCGMSHCCLAYVYYCGRADPRLQRLSLTHCQHALEQLPKHSSEATILAAKLLEAKVTRRLTQKGQPSWAGDARAASILCDVTLLRLAVPALPADIGEVVGSQEERVRSVLLTSGDEGGATQLMTFLRQELSSILLRLLKVEQDGVGRDLKTLYCSLLTAWHAEAGQAEALSALAAHLRRILAT